MTTLIQHGNTNNNAINKLRKQYRAKKKRKRNLKRNSVLLIVAEEYLLDNNKQLNHGGTSKAMLCKPLQEVKGCKRLKLFWS